MSYSVDYKKLFPVGDAIRQESKTLNKLILDAHETLVQMHETWDGKRWGVVAKLWNSMMPSFEQTCEFLVKQVPYVIEVDAHNYASVDGGSVGEPFQFAPESFPKELPEGLRSICLSDENATEEKKYKDKLDQCFNEAISSLNKIEEDLNSTKGSNMWEGPAAERTRTTFAETKETILTNITKMKNQVLTCINEAISDLKDQEDNADANANAFK